MRRLTNDMEPAIARRIAREEFGDVRARMVLIDLAEHLYGNNQKLASATLMHAEAYLVDRAAYELEPWPKGMIRVPNVRKGMHND